MARKFEVDTDKAGEFRFRLKAPATARSSPPARGCTSKAGCLNGTESVKNAVDAPVVDQAT